MTELIISIISSSLLFFIFRLFPKYGVDTAQAIIVNYFTAFCCGCLVNRSLPSIAALRETPLLPWILLAGFLFISLFIGMGISSYKNGMGTTSVAVKMSMALSMIFFIVAYNEAVTWMKIAGFLLAFTGIFLITFEKNTTGDRGNSLFLLLFLFVGSAGLDIVLNYVKKKLIGDYPDSLFTAFGFLAAGCLGLLWMITEYLRGKRKFSWNNVLGGILLGIPNYFSIYLLIRSYETTGWNDTTTLAITGIAIVSVAALCGMLIFKESARWQKIAGLVSAIGAILLLGIFSNE
jgi:drug/metabolite transporter (DMT)-like permease